LTYRPRHRKQQKTGMPVASTMIPQTGTFGSGAGVVVVAGSSGTSKTPYDENDSVSAVTVPAVASTVEPGFSSHSPVVEL